MGNQGCSRAKGRTGGATFFKRKCPRHFRYMNRKQKSFFPAERNPIPWTWEESEINQTFPVQPRFRTGLAVQGRGIGPNSAWTVPGLVQSNSAANMNYVTTWPTRNLQYISALFQRLLTVQRRSPSINGFLEIQLTQLLSFRIQYGLIYQHLAPKTTPFQLWKTRERTTSQTQRHFNSENWRWIKVLHNTHEPLLPAQTANRYRTTVLSQLEMPPVRLLARFRSWLALKVTVTL